MTSSSHILQTSGERQKWVKDNIKFNDYRRIRPIGPMKHSNDTSACYLSGIDKMSPVQRLEKTTACILKFQELDEYRENDQFIKLCFDIAELTGSPEELFIYMYNHKIGIARAYIFEKWAQFLMEQSRMKEARNVVLKGIKAKAQPESHLEELLQKLNRSFASVNKVKESRCSHTHGAGSRKLGVYVGDSDSESDCDITSPDSPQLKPEDVVHPKLRKSYPYRSLCSRDFTQPSGPFKSTGLAVDTVQTFDTRTTFQSTAALERSMYEQHQRVTEPIASARIGYSGDTEAL